MSEGGAASNKRKGTRRENEVKKQLEDEGYTIAHKSYTMRLGNSGLFRAIDFAGLFDIVAIKGKEWRLVSVKGYKITKKHAHWRQIVNWAKQHALSGMVAELWSYDPSRTTYVWAHKITSNGKLVKVRQKTSKQPEWLKYKYEHKYEAVKI